MRELFRERGIIAGELEGALVKIEERRTLRLQQWMKHILVYGFGVLLINFLPTLLVPIYTYRIPPSEYGVLELLNRSQGILLLLLSLGLRQAVTTFYQMRNDDPERQKGVYSSSLQFLAVFGVVAMLASLTGAGKLSELLFDSRSYAADAVLMLLATYFEMLFQAAVLYLQSELRSVLYISVFVSRSVLAIILNLVLVFWWRLGLWGILWATLLHTGIFAVGLLVYTLWSTWERPDKHLLGEMLRFGAPLAVGSIAMFILDNGDRYFLNIYAGRAAVGIYGLGYKIGMLSTALVLAPFLKIWSVTMVDISRKPEGKQELGKIATYLLAVSMFATLGLSLLGPYLVELLAERSYWDAYRVIPVVGAAYLFYIWTIVMDASFYVTKRTVYKLYNVLIGCAIVLLFYWKLIPGYGMMGAAWATLAGFASFAAVALFFAQRVFRIDYEFGRIAKLFLLGVALFEIGNLISVAPLATGLIARAAITLAFPMILWLGGFFTEDERHALGGYWQSLRVRYLGGVRA